ncbi:MAG: hypothetical protein HC926_06100 [Synechococcaceae cyanobacterium SM2_3_60]|nr:hypothetical protein [Synechococcaceae cyanobacterium SM2_3_60]
MRHYLPEWLRVTLRWRGTVVPLIRGQVLFCSGFALLVTQFYHWDLPVAHNVLGSIIPGVVLGLLLVFRTNTAYERFWEGRKLWGTLVNTVRNLARQVCISVKVGSPQELAAQMNCLRLLVAFAIAMKQHLRQVPLADAVAHLVDPAVNTELQAVHNPPLDIAFRIGDYLEQQFIQGRLELFQLTGMQMLLNMMVDSLGGCERILKTPIPLAYAIHLRQLILLYCLLLPADLVDDLGWWTSPVIGIVSFALFGIEGIGVEIENPFGLDPNDLPLDTICQTMERNIDDLITLRGHTPLGKVLQASEPFG